MSILDNTAIARIAALDLAGDTLALLEKHGDNDDVVFFLGRLVWQGNMTAAVPALARIAADPTRGRYARIAAMRAVMSIGTEDQKDALWTAVAAEPGPLDRRLLAELLEWAAPTARSIALLLQTIDRLAPYERFESTGLSQALHGFIDRLPVMADSAPEQPLALLVQGLVPFLDREPFIERGECQVSKAFAWLMAVAVHAVDRLVAARTPQALDKSALSVLMNLPALRYWRGDDMRDYQSGLVANVPRWRELNDTLYWTSIAHRRIHLAKKGERLVDDWQVTFLGHFWSFGPEDFDRCLGWVTEKAFLDDRLVALSRCIAIYVQADRPTEWLDRLRTAAEGEADLVAALESALNPKPSPAIVKMEANHQKWQDEQEARERKEEQDRADWVRMLQNDPNRVRHPEGLQPGDLSGDQFHLMMSLPGDGVVTDRDREIEWQALTPEFGEDVARAFRNAAVAHWRSYTPALVSEGASATSTPYALIFGMTGLAIESREVAGFPDNLSEDEARHAFRYITWELNGFPRWFEAMYRKFPEIGLEAVRRELIWELEHSTPDQPMHHLLHDIVYHAPWLHEMIAPILFDWIESHALQNPDGVRYSLVILASGGIAPATLAGLARKKIAAETDSQKPRWFALWVDTDPEAAIAALEALLDGLDAAAASQFAQQFVTSLLGDRHGAASRFGAFRTAAHLKALIVLMHRHIRTEEDIDRMGKGAYSPTLRDNAQDSRDVLFNQLAELPGPESYAALKALQQEHPVERYRKWMAVRARERAIADADEPLWTPGQVHRFMSELLSSGTA